jgi:PAS domain S-box-containing protein
MTRVVVTVFLAGAACTGLVLAAFPAGEPVVTLGWLGGTPLVAAMLGLNCAAELLAVRLRREEAVEELTLLDPVVLVTVLLLPPRPALLTSLLGLLLVYLWRRREVLKTLYNLGTYAIATSLLIVLLRAVSGEPGEIGVRAVAAMLLGTAGFVLVNVVSISLLLAAMGLGRPLRLIQQDLRGSVFTLVSTVALAATGVSVALSSPILLPFTALPAAAIMYAYRATATEVEEHQQSARVLAFSRVLASSPPRSVAVTAFLQLARDGFQADDVFVVLAAGDVLTLPAAGPPPLMALEESLLARAGQGALLLIEDLPAGWTSLVLAPLGTGGNQVGVAVIGRRGRRRLRPGDLTVLTSLTSALAEALASAEHLDRLTAESSKLRAVVDESSDGILVLDGDGIVQLWNPALERLSGRGESQAIGAPLAELLDARDLEGRSLDAFAEARRRLSAGTPRVTIDLELIRPDGERRSVRCVYAATFDGEALVRSVVDVHDLTRERQLDRLKSDFVATVSHELRTPITPIKGYADLLKRKGDSLSPQKRAKAIDVIADRAGHMARLVEDLLLASNVSNGSEPLRSIVLEAADLSGLAVRAMEDFTAATARLSTTLPAEPVLVSCDPVRAIQVLTNLISNAVKYSPAGSPIEIRVERGEDGGRVVVRDRGRGLPEDQLERIFEKFHRVEDPMVMSTSGTGLGLFIARHLARAMDGELTVCSTLGEGSAFTLRLPLRPAPEISPG